MRAINNRAITGCMCALGCEAIFGLSYIFTKTGTEDASAFALLGWRFLIAVVGMSICVVLGFIKIDLRGKSLKPLLLVALFSPCTYFIGETIGISNTTASESGIFLACIPIFLAYRVNYDFKEEAIQNSDHWNYDHIGGCNRNSNFSRCVFQFFYLWICISDDCGDFVRTL